jgi:hypothetical protein
MFMSCHRTTGQNPHTKAANKAFENVARFKCFRTTAANQNYIHEESNSTLNSGKACHHAVRNLLSSRLLSRNVKIKTYKTVMLSVVLYGCETRSLTLRGKHRLRVFENRVLRKIFAPKSDEVTGG